MQLPTDGERATIPIRKQLDKIIGNHQIKFGADIRYAMNLRVPSDANRTGI